MTSLESDQCMHRSEQLEGWDEEDREKLLDIYPKARHSAAFEGLRNTLRQDQACSVFCRGKQCKYDNDKWPKERMAIDGIYSSWITKNILAMARPNTINMKKHNMVDEFLKVGIRSIINLELPGEHASCGHGLEPSGFSYNQQDFMDKDIFCYNFGWPDWSVGSLNNVLDAAQVMQFALAQGKVAVHCHAGHGRTGVMIACFLVFINRISPWEAVHYVRTKRSHCLQTESQVRFVKDFHQFLKHLRVVFSTNSTDDPTVHDFTLPQFMIRQQKILHGAELRRCKNVPKVLLECCERLLVLAGRMNYDNSKNMTNHDICHNDQSSTSVTTPYGDVNRTKVKVKSKTSNPNNNLVLCDSDGTKLKHHAIGDSSSAEVVAYALGQYDYDDEVICQCNELKKLLNMDHCGYEELSRLSDPRVVARLMCDWMDNLKEPILQAQDLPHMLDYTSDPREGLKLLNKGARHTVELLFRTIGQLEPLSDDTERRVVQRVLSTLTHQNVVVEMELLFSEDKHLIHRTSNTSGLMGDCLAGKLMYFFMHLLHVMQLDLSKDRRKIPSKSYETVAEKSRTRDITGNGSGDQAPISGCLADGETHKIITDRDNTGADVLPKKVRSHTLRSSRDKKSRTSKNKFENGDSLAIDLNQDVNVQRTSSNIETNEESSSDEDVIVSARQGRKPNSAV